MITDSFTTKEVQNRIDEIKYKECNALRHTYLERPTILVEKERKEQKSMDSALNVFNTVNTIQK